MTPHQARVARVQAAAGEPVVPGPVAGRWLKEWAGEVDLLVAELTAIRKAHPHKGWRYYAVVLASRLREIAAAWEGEEPLSEYEQELRGLYQTFEAQRARMRR